MWPFKPKIVEKIVEVKQPVFIQYQAKKLGTFRRGMWIQWQGRCGILHKFDGDKVEIHFVDKNGLTEEVKLVPVVDVSQARKSQVPECRRGNIDKFDYQE